MDTEYVGKHAKKSAVIGPDSVGPSRHERKTREAVTFPRPENRDNGRKAFDTKGARTVIKEKFSKIFTDKTEKLRNKEALFSDYAVSMTSRGNLTGNPNRPSEDQAIIDADQGMFAVFDGAGGVRGGAEASATAARALSYCLSEQGPPKNMAEMHSLMTAINRSVTANPNAGMTTAVVGRILEDDKGQRQLLYASVGDSRLYHIYDGDAHQVTKDEGYGNIVTNSFGKSNGQPVCTGVHQVGIFPLEKGDSLLFNSDGITGDFEKDFIPEPEIAHLVETAKTPKEAANRLVDRATKIDDRTALVVKI